MVYLLDVMKRDACWNDFCSCLVEVDCLGDGLFSFESVMQCYWKDGDAEVNADVWGDEVRVHKSGVFAEVGEGHGEVDCCGALADAALG